MTSIVSWLPVELEPVAMRLGRADELAYQLGQVAFSWSRNGGESAVEIKQVRSPTAGIVDAVVAGIRPIPPSAAMLFSEVIHHLRAALDNVVFHLVTAARGQALSEDDARKVALPIYQQQSQFADWAKRTVGKVPELADSTSPLYQRIESLQPYASTADVPSLPPALAALMGVKPENAHALLLLQSYSNEDKHRSIRLAVPRSAIQRSDQSFFTADRTMQPIEVGAIIASVREGEPVLLELNPAIIVERPDTATWVSPGAELTKLHAYVAHVAIPTLLTGSAPAEPSLPETIDLSDNGQTMAERIDAGGHVNSHDRLRPAMERSVMEQLGQPPTVLQAEK